MMPSSSELIENKRSLPLSQQEDTQVSNVEGDYEALVFEQHERKNFSFSIGKGAWGIRINPVSFVLSVIVIWGFAIWAMVAPVSAMEDLGKATAWVTNTLTWAYMLSQQVWVVFLLVLYISPLGNIKLGKPKDEPDYPVASWFMMMFSAGIGVGLFFFGVAEPVYHYEPCYGAPHAGPGSECFGSRYSQLQADVRAQWAMNITFFHWGIHAWVVYVIVGLLLGVLVYRRDLPMTMKSAFHPLIGDKVFGWMGDVIDTVSVATTLFGVCTSLGLGVKQINAGLNRVNPSIPVNNISQVAIIWSITLLATISVVSGVKLGIRRLSEVNWLLAQFICFVALFQEDTWYLLNNFTQSIGFYFQKFIALGLHCDTFQMSPDRVVEGEAVTAVAPDGLGSSPSWMNDWTIFYWGWWIAWAPFVGMFIAKISRGRTVRQIINGSLTAPVIYIFFWFSVFGGIGLRIERDAANLGVTCSTADDGSTLFQRVLPDNTTEVLEAPFVSVGGVEYWRLSCRGTAEMWFDMLTNFPMHQFYWGLSIASLILYFVTSSDSGSLVIDCLTSNGNPHPPILQRVFWSATEGAVAMALLLVGSTESLSALRAVSIIAGAPYTLVICFMCKSLWDALTLEWLEEREMTAEKRPPWVTGLLDVLDPPTFNLERLGKTVLALVAPWYYAGRAAAWVSETTPNLFQAVYALMFYAWPLLLVFNQAQKGLWALGWTAYVGWAMHVAYVRGSIRAKRGNIIGDVFSDIVLSHIFYPFVAVQMFDEVAADNEVPVDPSRHVSDTPSLTT